MKQNRTLYIACVFLCLLSPECYSREAMATTTSGIKDSGGFYSDDQIANAIYRAEGGSATRHPYGILQHYKHTTPRQACINTIRHARKDWNGKGDFILFLGNRYCPIGAKNDPTGLNVNWIRNVKYFLAKGV